MSIGMLALESLNAEPDVVSIFAEEVTAEGEDVVVVVWLDADGVWAVTIRDCGLDDGGDIAIMVTKIRATIDDSTEDNGFLLYFLKSLNKSQWSFINDIPPTVKDSL